MQEKIEGVLISKTPFKERDIIGKLLLRSGKTISVLFYGGRGGGKKQKTSLTEFGYMLDVTLSKSRNKNSDMYSAKEWKIIWSHRKIRENHEAFYLMCFYLELIKKLSISDNLHDENRSYDDNLEGLFRVLSNALFYLEDSILKKSFMKNSHLFLFLLKLTQELGVAPTMKECVLCDINFNKSKATILSPEQGGFICDNCLQDNLTSTPNNEEKNIQYHIENCFHTKYIDWNTVNIKDNSVPRTILNYIAYQFHINIKDLNSVAFL